MAAPVPSDYYRNRTPLTVEDWLERPNILAGGRLYTQAEAEQKVAEAVFGVGFKTDADGNPIESGKGSALQPTQQHREALAREAERQAMMGRHMTPETIASAIAEVMKVTGAANAMTPEHFAAAVVAAVNAKPRGRPGRKPKQLQPSEPNAAA